jgi:hypothetical protein
MRVERQPARPLDLDRVALTSVHQPAREPIGECVGELLRVSGLGRDRQVAIRLLLETGLQCVASSLVLETDGQPAGRGDGSQRTEALAEFDVRIGAGEGPPPGRPGAVGDEVGGVVGVEPPEPVTEFVGGGDGPLAEGGTARVMTCEGPSGGAGERGGGTGAGPDPARPAPSAGCGGDVDDASLPV